MVDYAYKELFNQDSVDKQIIITFDGGEITNSDIYSESFELKESLCSDEELRFGSCEASVLKLKIRNEFGELKNKWLDVSMILGGNADIPFQIGRYKVHSDQPNGDRKHTNITAYDALYDIINADVAGWYNSLEFPIAQKNFRDSFFSYFGIEQVETELIQDTMLIEQTINTTTLSGKDVINSICELNGVFGHINRLGKFVYVSLSATCEELYGDRYISCEYEDFETNFISKIQIRQEENDIGTIVGDGTNTYIIENNFLVYGKGPEELEEIATSVLAKICLIQYRPSTISLKGNPCLEVGDGIVCHTRGKNVETYILQRTIKGIQSLRDNFVSRGTLEYSEKVNSVHRQINQLRGKTNVLERTVEKTISKIEDVENQVSTTVTQTVEGLKIEIEETIGDVGSLKEEVGKNTDAVKKSTYEFSTEDLQISKEGSEMTTHISEDGMTVKRSGQDVLIANNKGVEAYDLHAKSYLIIGRNSRFEDYDSGKRTGCFWIGS